MMPNTTPLPDFIKAELGTPDAPRLWAFHRIKKPGSERTNPSAGLYVDEKHQHLLITRPSEDIEIRLKFWSLRRSTAGIDLSLKIPDGLVATFVDLKEAPRF